MAFFENLIYFYLETSIFNKRDSGAPPSLSDTLDTHEQFTGKDEQIRNLNAEMMNKERHINELTMELKK